MSIATLDNGKANALDLAMIETLVAHVDAITDDGALVNGALDKGIFDGIEKLLEVAANPAQC